MIQDGFIRIWQLAEFLVWEGHYISHNCLILAGMVATRLSSSSRLILAHSYGSREVFKKRNKRQQHFSSLSLYPKLFSCWPKGAILLPAYNSHYFKFSCAVTGYIKDLVELDSMYLYYICLELPLQYSTFKSCHEGRRWGQLFQVLYNQRQVRRNFTAVLKWVLLGLSGSGGKRY